MRCCLPLVFLLLIQKVSLLEIEGFVGDTVILPCLSSGKELPNKVTVFWRFRDSGTVYDIFDSRASLDEQDVPFRGRVDSFPDEWTKGNFSIKLSRLKKTDGGMYTCFIPGVNIQTTIYLIVNVSLQDVQAFVGDTVILPCSNSHEALLVKGTVFWRFGDTITVYDITDSSVNFDEQATSYKNRVDTFPAEWTKGNFSIKLRDVRKSDGGTYTCFLLNVNAKNKVQLTVKDRPVTPTDSNSRNGNVRRRPDRLSLLFAFLLGCSLLCA
ncbi:CD276 antigen-like isoform X2 [Pygocentrus nattereri]|uniref:CD276 antigen-like isoform X2 n=1 Tax=Pygocentrus nattereri TaxID=42514 RepID=UPI00189152B1|nr:CD276 antigen-like isoform X2 [Pygocentrus nattereri]